MRDGHVLALPAPDREGPKRFRGSRLRRPPRGDPGGSKLHLNPYKLGVELFRDIEERWNKGRFGKEYEECED